MGAMPRLRRSSAGWLLAIAAVLVVPLVVGLGGLGTGGATASAAASPTRAANAVQTSDPTPPDSSVPSASVAPAASVVPSAPVAPVASDPPTTDAIRPGSVNATSMNLTAEYSATIRLNFGTRSFRVDEAIIVTNTSGAPIDRLELNTIAARLGRMTISGASVDGIAVSPTVSDQTIRVPLGGILDAGATAVVRLGYRATLRADLAGSNWLFTRVNGIVSAHRWLPWISRATPFDRPNHGDPFVTPVSPRVRVTINSDRVISWATTGEQVAGSGTTKTFEARNVRDFAMSGAPDYRVTSASVGGVMVHVWGRPGFATASVMAAAKTALAREAALLGPYPYRTYDVAQSAGGYGMESPGLTWIPGGAGSIAYLVAHETAHQWFYGIVGNDQARQPFADEAAADFIARYITGLRRLPRCSTARLDLTIYQYSSTCYYETVYIQGGNFLDDTRKKMGATAFWAGIRDYLATNRFRITTTKSLLDTLDEHTPLNLVPRYEPRFPGIY
jgi:hypothetical protein